MCQKQLNIRVPAHELKILDSYAKETKRTKTEILREFIRSLNKKPKILQGSK
ncbi:MAG: ribbon-helix-helix protein, CopG family [Xenococcaceae cyanobacterium MO_167.B52]|nr:ribbon-helix-helix protein, CopG family [Xenococcaceae cyanobacterium MO_167.B52]